MRSHAAGMGDLVEPEVVRAMVLLRARSLAMGRSGARPEVVDVLLAMLNAGLTPVVHEHGSLGASGDLAPLAHCALALIGEGEVWDSDGLASCRRSPGRGRAGAGRRCGPRRDWRSSTAPTASSACSCSPWPTSTSCSRGGRRHRAR